MKALLLVFCFWIGVSILAGYSIGLAGVIATEHLAWAITLGMVPVVMLSAFLWFVFRELW